MRDYPVNRERLLATFREMVQIDGPSRREGTIARHVTGILEGLGAVVTVDRAHEQIGGETGNLIARLPGVPGLPTLMLNAHLDTIEPTAGLHITEPEPGILASDGTTILGADDRTGVTAIIETLRILAETDTPHPPLEIVFTVAEEVGLMGSSVIADGALTAAYGFVPDSSMPVGMIITRAPAQQHLTVVVHGKAAHAGMAPEEGINAIVIAARAIAAMQLGRIDEETTANIGIIAGGKATNIVPETVTLEGEARSRDPQKLTAQVEHMRAAFIHAAATAGATVDITVSDVYPAFNLDEASAPVQLAKAALAEIGILPIVTATGGGSDANFFNRLGVPTVILSTGYSQVHCCDERQDVEQLVQLVRWMYQIVRLAGVGR